MTIVCDITIFKDVARDVTHIIKNAGNNGFFTYGIKVNNETRGMSGFIGTVAGGGGNEMLTITGQGMVGVNVQLPLASAVVLPSSASPS